jgi:hypothetical protein
MLITTRKAAAVILGLCWAFAGTAQAQSKPASDGMPIVVEGHVGLNDPLGAFGLALVYDQRGRFSAGLGLGADSNQGRSLLATSLFGRVRFLRVGPFALDAGAILSRGSNSKTVDYSPPSTSPYLGARLVWNWNPAYRATATLAAELANRRWSLRLEAGLAYILNHPTCHYQYQEGRTDFIGDCNSPEIPDRYHFSTPPGQVVPSLAVTVGYRLGVTDPDDGSLPAGGVGYRSPREALRLSLLSTLVPTLVGATMFGAWIIGNHDNSYLGIGGIAGMGLGLSLGPSMGHVYSGEHLYGWGMGFLRLVGSGIGAYAILIAGLESSCPDFPCNTSRQSKAEAVAVVALTGVVVSAAYDIVTAPRAARRANAKHGLTNLGLVPTPIAGRTSTTPGLSLVGQF